VGAQETQSIAVNGGTPTVTTTSYTYDEAGNRLSMVQGADALYYHYNDYDQLVCTDTDNNINTTGDIVTSYTYDLSGNQITKTEGTSTTTYHYDDANWLQYVTSGSLTIASYDYDASGQRTQKTAGPDETNYFYSGLQLLYTENESGAILEQNILEIDGSMVCSRRTDTNYYWYRQDICGSVTNIVDEDDDVVKSYTYDAYGNTDSSGAFLNSFAYTGLI
jgi:YD repeat-containing protein